MNQTCHFISYDSESNDNGLSSVTRWVYIFEGGFPRRIICHGVSHSRDSKNWLSWNNKSITLAVPASSSPFIVNSTSILCSLSVQSTLLLICWACLFWRGEIFTFPWQFVMIQERAAWFVQLSIFLHDFRPYNRCHFSCPHRNSIHFRFNLRVSLISLLFYL